MDANQTLEPVEAKSRLKTLDVLRGLAILGILLMNIPIMGMVGPWPKPDFPTALNPDWIAWLVQDTVFNGAMRGLFTLLFGAGMLLMLGVGADDSRRTQAYFVRCLILMLLGVVNFTVFLWPGEILFCYGVIGLILFAFRHAGIRLLWTASVTCLVVMTVALTAYQLPHIELLREAPAAQLLQADGHPLTERQTEAVKAMNETNANIHPQAEVLQKELEARTSWPSVLEWSTTKWVWYSLDSVSPWYFMASLGLMLMGMALYRMGILTGERSLGFYLAMALYGYVIGIGIRGGYNAMAWQAGFEVNPNVYLVRRIVFEAGHVAVTLGAVGTVLALCKAGLFRRLQGALQAVGRMSLTNYVGQSAITSILFYGFGWLGRFGFAELMLLCLPIWIGQIIFSLVWLKIFTMGPLEWLLRTLTYGRRLPLFKAASTQPLKVGGASTATYNERGDPPAKASGSPLKTQLATLKACARSAAS